MKVLSLALWFFNTSIPLMDSILQSLPHNTAQRNSLLSKSFNDNWYRHSRFVVGSCTEIGLREPEEASDKGQAGQASLRCLAYHPLTRTNLSNQRTATHKRRGRGFPHPPIAYSGSYTVSVPIDLSPTIIEETNPSSQTARLDTLGRSQ